MKTVILSLVLLAMYPGKRMIYIFYNSTGAALKNQQLAGLNADPKGLLERDIEIKITDQQSVAARPEIKKWHIDIARPFTVILVGKDGGEKLRSDTVITNSYFFETIDAMPMRKMEMQKQ